MKIGVISDTHGRKWALQSALGKMGKVDIIFHLGDVCSDAAYIEEIMSMPVICVRGNCDLFSTEPEKREMKIAGKRFFLTHGHLYRIKWGKQNLVYKAKETGADVVLFGHTHVPEVFYESGILFFNPGSVALPRSSTGRTFGILEVTEGKIIPKIVKV